MTPGIRTHDGYRSDVADHICNGLLYSGLPSELHCIKNFHAFARDTPMIVRPEMPADIPHIRYLTEAAFKGVEHSSQTEGAIIDALRQAGALAISLVAAEGEAIFGHVAFSPVLTGGKQQGWFGLGPVSVLPSHQRKGIGTMLIRHGLSALKERGAAGCVVLGDPDYYRRFGFNCDHALYYSDVPAHYFQSLALSDTRPEGAVTYHKGFDAV